MFPASAEASFPSEGLDDDSEARKSRGKQIRIQKTELLWIFLLVFLVEWITDIIET